MRTMLFVVTVVCSILTGCASPGMGGGGSETASPTERMPGPDNPSAPDYRGGGE